MDATQVLRITLREGTQICDFNAWNRHDPREAFWSGRTRAFENMHLTTFHRHWSTPPKMRPITTLIEDTVRHRPLPGGSPGHDCLGARCTARMSELIADLHDHANCQANVERAIAPFGLQPHAHDPFNLFMNTGASPDDGRHYLAPSDAVPGDYVELYAEIDLVVGLSSCRRAMACWVLPTASRSTPVAIGSSPPVEMGAASANCGNRRCCNIKTR